MSTDPKSEQASAHQSRKLIGVAKQASSRIVRIADLGRDFAASFTLGESKLKSKVSLHQVSGNSLKASSLLQHKEGLITDLEDYDYDDDRMLEYNAESSIPIQDDCKKLQIFSKRNTHGSLDSSRSTYNFCQGLLNKAEISNLQEPKHQCDLHHAV